MRASRRWHESLFSQISSPHHLTRFSFLTQLVHEAKFILCAVFQIITQQKTELLDSSVSFLAQRF
jgi:hypothetical protein